MLPEIRIASPCTANWDAMTGDDRARHCAECNLDVYNFSEMTSAEVEQLLAASKGQRVCGRFYRRADGTILTSDCPVGFRARVRRVSRRIGVALSAALSLGIANAQTQEHNGKSSKAEQPSPGLDIMVVNSSGVAVPDALVVVKNGPLRIAEGRTNSLGRFRLSIVAPGRYEVTASFSSSSGIGSAVTQIQLPQRQTELIVVKGPFGTAKAHPEALMGWVVTPSFEVPAEPSFIDQLAGKLFPLPAGTTSQQKPPSFQPTARK